MRSLIASAIVVVSVSAPACTADLDLATTSASLTDPVTACPVVDPDAIAGNEATFYLCAEDTLACGTSGYLIGYGAKYAERFYRKTRPWVSADGQAWLDATLV